MTPKGKKILMVMLEMVIGVLPATACAPVALLGVLMGYRGIVDPLFGRVHSPDVGIFLLGVAGLLGIAGLWFAVPFRETKIIRQKWYRYTVLVLLLAGCVSASYLIVHLTPGGYSALKDFLYLLALVGALLVAVEQFYVLTIGASKART